MIDDTRPPTVLIVKDEQPLADLFAQFLESAYTVHTANDGTEALDMMSDAVDVVLLDRRMPGLSGEDVLDAIRADKSKYDAPGDPAVLAQLAKVAESDRVGDDITLGFIGISNDPDYHAELSERANRVFDSDPITAPYSAADLEGILKRRASRTLTDTSYSSSDDQSFESTVLDRRLLLQCTNGQSSASTQHSTPFGISVLLRGSPIAILTPM